MTLIIDTDPGIDDLIAIIFALFHHDLQKLEAITLTYGNTTLDQCRDNIIRLFDVLQKHIAEDPNESHRAKLNEVLNKSSTPIILSQGADGPLGGKRFTASYFHGRDGASGTNRISPDNPFPLPNKIPAPLQETEKPAYQVILDILQEKPIGTVRIAAVGPLTNIAKAWQADPKTFLRVGGISVMGFALDVPGNTTPCAEFNTYADPFAAQKLLQEAPLFLNGQRLPIDILPLDLTTQHLVPYSRLADNNQSGVLQQYLSAIIQSSRRATNARAPAGKPLDRSKDDLFQAHDPLAVGHAIFCKSHFERKQDLNNKIDENFSGWHIKTREFGVETVGRLTRGFCVVDRRQNEPEAKSGLNQAETKKKEKPIQGKGIEKEIEANKKEMKEDEDDGIPNSGSFDVVISSPGSQWFADLLCQALHV